ncbi:MAG: nitrogen fixation protein NifH [Candidatus Aminicenantes bacterium]|nr:MAG: nitrogen fixation protein NifH [Candidatus Aminicenantes bacterium]
MNTWKSRLQADATPWLLEDNNPSVQYLTLTEIEGVPVSQPNVQASRNNIMKTGVIPKILAKQSPGGYWEKAEDFYIRTKYKGSVWTFIILAELMADPQDQHVQKTCEFILDWSQDRKSGGFSYRGSLKGGGYHSGIIPCLTGNMTWGLIRFGYLDDPRVRQAIDWITTYQRFDDGVSIAPQGWPYDRFEQCWGKHTCTLGVVKGLKALAEISPRRRTKSVKLFIQNASEFLLKHHVFRQSHNLDRVSKYKWTKLWFPWMWDTDVLEQLLILTRLEIRDKRMREAVDLVFSKQGKNGKWPLEDTYNGRFQVNIERKGKPSKWVTLNALRVLKKYYG